MFHPNSQKIEIFYTLGIIPNLLEYGICKELNLGINIDKNLTKNIEVKSKIKNSKTPHKFSIPNKKTDEDLLLSMTKRLNIVEQSLKESNLKLKKKDEEIVKLSKKILNMINLYYPKQ